MPENYHTTAGSWALIRLYTLRLYTFNYVSGQGEWVGLDELTALSRPGASLRPGRARRSRDDLATDSVRSKLPPLSVPVTPPPVSRETSRDFVALDRPFDDGRVQTVNVAVSTSTCPQMLYPI